MTEHEREVAKPWWAAAVPPWWLFLFFAAADLGTGAWRAITSSGDGARLFLASLIWPGLAVAAAVFIVAWLGWSLDLD
jgi:Na+/proline symporter